MPTVITFRGQSLPACYLIKDHRNFFAESRKRSVNWIRAWCVRELARAWFVFEWTRARVTSLTFLSRALLCLSKLIALRIIKLMPDTQTHFFFLKEKAVRRKSISHVGFLKPLSCCAHLSLRDWKHHQCNAKSHKSCCYFPLTLQTEYTRVTGLKYCYADSAFCAL